MERPPSLPLRRPGRDRHLGERLVLYHAAAWALAGGLALSASVAYYLAATRGIGAVAVVAIVLAGVCLALVAVGVVWVLSGVTARGVIQVITGSGDLAPGPSFSYQESLVARGRYADAVDSFRQHLLAHPEDHDARITLAGILAKHLSDPTGAETLYLEVRAGEPAPGHEMTVAQALIDLYAATGQRGRQMAELARFADRYRGSRAAAAARRALAELKGRAL
jgi:hypothetical protein